ncbi:endolytic transglycosylase MltG [bacterium]|nr:endolytic transglycosylase MltG [bacterium]
MSKKKIIFALLLLIVASFLWLIFEIYSVNYYLEASKVFEVKKGEDLFTIASNLSKQNLIKNKYAFIFYVLLKNKAHLLKAGDYEILPKMSIKEIADMIIQGKSRLIKITIPEGWNLRDIGFYFENLGMFQAEEIWEIAGFPATVYKEGIDLPKPRDFSQKYSFLKEKPTNIGLEGYLFPDTYFIPRDIKAEKIITMMLDNFDRKIDPQLREKIKRQNKTLFQIVTMASLLEKEAKNPEDKKIISGILWKRLRYRMPLQVDATISYITGKKSVKISNKETQIDSPYNTYKHEGLPIGPICNPGIESILAAVYPQETDYWYYLSTSEGKILYSKTLREHNLKKAKYLK